MNKLSSRVLAAFIGGSSDLFLFFSLLSVVLFLFFLVLL